MINDRVAETTVTTGTGTLSLAGAATGRISFVAGIGSGKQCYYVISDGVAAWEIGIGTVTSGSPATLSRTTILASSNGGAAVDWGAGTKTVRCTASHELFGAIGARLRGATSTGSANAYVLALAPAPRAYVDQMEIAFKSNFANTGAATLNVNGLGAKALRKGDGSTALVANDILSGQMVKALYDSGLDVLHVVSPLAGTSTALVQGKHTIGVPAPAMWARTTGGAAAGHTELATNKINFKSWDFDTAAEENVQFGVWMPKSWNEGTVTAQVVWTAASGSGGVVFGIRAIATSDDDPLDAAFGTEVNITDTLLAANDDHHSPESAAVTVGGTPLDNDYVTFQVARKVANGSDTLGVDAKLISVKLFITINAGDDT